MSARHSSPSLWVSLPMAMLFTTQTILAFRVLDQFDRALPVVALFCVGCLIAEVGQDFAARRVALILLCAAACVAATAGDYWLRHQQGICAQAEQHKAQYIEQRTESVRTSVVAGDFRAWEVRVSGHKSGLQWVVHPFAKPNKQRPEAAFLDGNISNAFQINSQGNQKNDAGNHSERLVPVVDSHRTERVFHAGSLAP